MPWDQSTARYLWLRLLGGAFGHPFMTLFFPASSFWAVILASAFGWCHAQVLFKSAQTRVRVLLVVPVHKVIGSLCCDSFSS